MKTRERVIEDLTSFGVFGLVDDYNIIFLSLYCQKYIRIVYWGWFFSDEISILCVWWGWPILARAVVTSFNIVPTVFPSFFFKLANRRCSIDIA